VFYWIASFYFHQHINCIFSQSLKVLRLIRYIASSFSTLDSLLALYSTLVRFKIEYASVAWNSTTNTDSAKLERIQRKFVALCYTRLFNGVCDFKYEDSLVRLNFLTLHLRRRHLDDLSLFNVFKGKISCSSVFDTVSLRIPTRSVRDYSTFTVHCNFKVSPSVRCVSAANAVCRSIDIFNRDCILLTDISQLSK
jgi:hypothetical protein